MPKDRSLQETGVLVDATELASIDKVFVLQCTSGLLLCFSLFCKPQPKQCSSVLMKLFSFYMF